MITKILVPVDFSETSGEALERAIDIARAAGAELVLLYADEFAVMGLGDATYVPAYVFEEHQRAMQRELAKLVEDTTARQVRARGLMVMSPAAQAIATAISEHKPDLVVMGTHGRHGLPRWILGSVTERVLRTSPVPVLAVPARSEQTRATRLRDDKSGRDSDREASSV